MGASRHIISGKGIHNARCDSCGLNFKSNELRKRWDGLMVCAKDYETRHPLDFLRVQNDQIAPAFVRDDPRPDFSLSFNGTSSYVSIPFAASRASIGATFTIQMSLYCKDLSSRQGLMSTLAGASANSWDLEMGPGNSSGIGRVLLRQVGGVSQFESPNNTLKLNQWNTLTYSRSPTGNIQRLMVNQQMIGEFSTSTFSTFAANVDTWYLGAFSASQFFFNGYMK